ncbi:MAG: hypothetical protein EBS31_09015, partial [Burkholderiaceae bacterium]|nr:hypothetical protein [Burkholderiaceae bacterium]
MIEILLAVAILIALGAGIYALKESQLRARLEAELEAERRQAAEKIALLQSSTQEAKDALSNQFKNLANEILEEKSRRFALQNQENLNVLLKPLSEKLSEFR